MANTASAQAWNGYSYVSNSPMSLVDPSGLSQAPVRGGCAMVGFACRQGGAAGGGFGLASVVSTHRFHWVDVFFSFVSSWFNPGWGGLAGTPPFNPNAPHYFRGGGFGHGGWDSYDSFGSFHFGIAFFSVAFQVTSHVAVAGTPDITHSDMKEELERELGRLFARGILDRENSYGSLDEAARAVLDILAPLSAKYGIELGGNIYEIEGRTSRRTGRVLESRFRYSIPVIGESTHVRMNTGFPGYHTHPSGDLVFSNPFYNARYDVTGGDANWVKKSGKSLYLGVVGPDGGVLVGICEPGKCPVLGREGTQPTRVVP